MSLANTQSVRRVTAQHSAHRDDIGDWPTAFIRFPELNEENRVSRLLARLPVIPGRAFRSGVDAT